MTLGWSGFSWVRRDDGQGHVNQAQPQRHFKASVPTLVAATVAHTAPPAWPCRSRLRWPCAHPLPCPWAQTLCPTSPLSSTGHIAASSPSSQDLWKIIHSVRCSLGWLLPLTWPFSPPSLTPSMNSGILLDRVTKKVVCVRGGGAGVSLFCVVRDHSPFSLEGWEGGQTDQHLSRW